MFTLRPYQTRDLTALRAELKNNQSVLYVAPCGSGKGTMISYMVERAVAANRRVIFTVKGKALVNDMSQRVGKLGIPHGVLMGGKRREHWHSVQVASIDTLHRMDVRPKADLFIADEADLSISPTWMKVVADYPQSKWVGLTATPTRLDGRGLGRKSGGIYDVMVKGPSELNLIKEGYLVKSRVLAPPPPKDLGAIKKTGGEFNPKQQAAICDKAKVIGDIVKHWRMHARDKKTAAFGVDQKHAFHIAESFREQGIGWAYVDADTPDNERQKIWDDLDNPTGNLMGVSSVGVTTVGWDHGIVSCLILARKTASLRLHRQILGRGSRLYPGKDHFLVLDHVGNTHLHFPYGLFEDEVDWQLEGDAAPKECDEQERVASITTCKVAGMVDGIMRLPCYATFHTGPDKCPYCGIPIMVRGRKVEQEDGELGEITEETKANNERIIRAVYQSLHRMQSEKGYKKGYAAVVFKSKYGFWPPKRWAEEVVTQ